MNDSLNVFLVGVSCGDRKRSFLPFFPSSPPSLTLVFIRPLLYIKHCSRILHALPRIISSQTSLEISTNPTLLLSGSPVSFHGVITYSVPWYCVWLFPPPQPDIQQTASSVSHIWLLLLIPPALIISARHKSLFITGLSLQPGYHSTHELVDIPALIQNYVIPIVYII